MTEHNDEANLQRALYDARVSQPEFAINTTCLRTLFEDKDMDEAAWEVLGELLADSLRARAEAVFLQRGFRLTFEWYLNIGDSEITLYQE